MIPVSKLRGYLGGFDLTDVLQLISQHQKTGTLRVEHGEEWCVLRFENGRFVGLSCSFAGGYLDLGEMLVAGGLLLPRQLQDLRQQELRQGTAFDDLLTGGKIISADRLAELNQVRLYEALAVILRWKSGSYRFTPGRDAGRSPFFNPQPADFVVLEILRQLDEMEVLRQQVGPPEQLFEVLTTFAGGEVLFGDEIDEQYDETERGILAALRRGATVAESRDTTMCGTYRAYRSIAAFIANGLVVPLGIKVELPTGAVRLVTRIQRLPDLLLPLLLILLVAVGIQSFIRPVLPAWHRASPAAGLGIILEPRYQLAVSERRQAEKLLEYSPPQSK
jgi:hypothetical protein